MMTNVRAGLLGRLITIEGIEGAGKSTQAVSLATWVSARGREVVVTSEPDGTPLGARIREILGEVPPLDPVAECLLFAAARAEHVRRVMRPALERGAVVICDRYVDSTVAYQGHGRGVDLEVVATLNRLATDGLQPDVTIVLDLDVTQGLRRAQGRSRVERTPGEPGGPDPFERLGLEFHERVRKGYRAVQERHPERVTLIDASHPEAAVAAAVRAVVAGRLELEDAR